MFYQLIIQTYFNLFFILFGQLLQFLAPKLLRISPLINE